MMKNPLPIILLLVPLAGGWHCAENPADPVKPFEPELIEPVEGTLYTQEDTINLSWTVMTSGPTSYTLQVAADSLFTQLVVDNDTLATTSFPVTGLDTIPGYYYVRVKAINKDGESGWSTVNKFMVQHRVFITDTVTAGLDPQGVICLPDSQQVYVADHNGQQVLVFNTADHSPAGAISLSFSPHEFAIHPSGSLVYVLGNSALAVIRTADQAVISSKSGGFGLGDINTHYRPNNFTVHPDGSSLYIADGMHDRVLVLNTSDLSQQTSISLTGQPHGITILPAGDYAYVATWLGQQVKVIRLSDHQLIKSLDINGYPFALYSGLNDTYVYVATHDGMVRISTAGHTVAGDVQGARFSTIAAMVPGGKYMYTVREHLSGNVYLAVVDLVINTIVYQKQVVPPGGQPYTGLAASPDGNRVYVTSPENKYLMVLNAFR